MASMLLHRQMQEQFDNVAKNDAIEELADLDQFGIDYTLEVAEINFRKQRPTHGRKSEMAAADRLCCSSC